MFYFLLQQQFYAANLDKKILCPNFKSTIKKAAYKIDVAKMDGYVDWHPTYVAFTSDYDAFEENGIHWRISVSHVKANSVDDAIFLGKLMVENANPTYHHPPDNYADKLDDRYVCMYGRELEVSVEGIRIEG